MKEIIKTYFLEEKKKNNETKIGIKKEKHINNNKYDLNLKIYNKSNKKTFVLKNMTKKEIDLFEGELYRIMFFYKIL